MRKILYVTTVSRTINAFLVPHIEMLIEEGYKVDVACSIDKEIKKALVNKGVQVYDIPFSRSPLDKKNISAYKEIKSLVRKNQYDIVHVHTPVASFVTRLSLRNKNVEMIYTAHGFHFYKGASILNWLVYYPLERVAARWTDKIVTINNEDFNQANKFKLRGSKKSIKINGVGLDLSKYALDESNKNEFRKSLGIFENDFVITVVAELIKRKNHMQLIKAIEEIRHKYENIKVLLVGDGILTEKIKEYLIEKKLENNISILGYRSDVNKIMSISDVVGLFSIQEGLPRNIMEAMAIGKPVICTDIRGNNDLVKNDYNGLLIPVNDIEKTKEAIEIMYMNRERSKKYGECGLRKVKKYDIKNVLKEMKEIVYN